MLAVLVLSAGLGSSNLVVDTEYSTAPFSQTPSTLVLSSPAAAGSSLFADFLGEPQNWSPVNFLYLRAALAGENPAVFFVVTLLDQDQRAIASYEGSPQPAGNSLSLLPLQLTETSSGDLSRLRGLEIVWNGQTEVGSGLSIEALVGSDAPIPPTITSIGYAGGAFSMTWSGFGNLPVNIERRASLTSGNWTTIATGITVGSYTDSSPPTGKAFYRVVVP